MEAVKKLIITEPSFYLSFEGRLSRNQYLMNWFFPVLALMIVMQVITHIIPAFALLALLVNLALLWPNLAINSRRLHDSNKSGWLQLVLLIPLLGAIYMIYMLCFRKGDESENGFGVVPMQMALEMPK